MESWFNRFTRSSSKLWVASFGASEVELVVWSWEMDDGESWEVGAAWSWEVGVALSWVTSLDCCCWKRDSCCWAWTFSSSGRASHRTGIALASMFSSSCMPITTHPSSPHLIRIELTTRMGALAHGVLLRTGGGFSPSSRCITCVLPAPAEPVKMHLFIRARIVPFLKASCSNFLDSVGEQVSSLYNDRVPSTQWVVFPVKWSMNTTIVYKEDRPWICNSKSHLTGTLWGALPYTVNLHCRWYIASFPGLLCLQFLIPFSMQF